MALHHRTHASDEANQREQTQAHEHTKLELRTDYHKIMEPGAGLHMYHWHRYLGIIVSKAMVPPTCRVQNFTRSHDLGFLVQYGHT